MGSTREISSSPDISQIDWPYLVPQNFNAHPNNTNQRGNRFGFHKWFTWVLWASDQVQKLELKRSMANPMFFNDAFRKLEEFDSTYIISHKGTNAVENHFLFVSFFKFQKT